MHGEQSSTRNKNQRSRGTSSSSGQEATTSRAVAEQQRSEGAIEQELHSKDNASLSASEPAVSQPAAEQSSAQDLNSTEGISSNVSSSADVTSSGLQIHCETKSSKRTRLSEEGSTTELQIEPSTTRKRQFDWEGNSASSNSRKRSIVNNESSSNRSQETEIVAGLKTELNISSEEETNRLLKRQLAKINRSLNMQRVNAEREQRKKQLQEAQQKT